MRNFNDLLHAQWAQGHFLCVGLDPDYEKIPASVKTGDIAKDIVTFNKAIIDATKGVAAAYKPNTAFYEAYGAEGIKALEQTTAYIHAVAPDTVLIIDAKRADIGNTNIGYAKFVFDILQGDAVTVQPYMGGEALQPFFDSKEKGIIVLCRTSNPSAAEIQELEVNGTPLYQHVATLAVEKWNAHGNCALVIGATVPDEITAVREIVGEMPFLIPGIGAQGGDLEKTVQAAMNNKKTGFLISASRSILFASSGETFATAARTEAMRLHTQIEEIRSQL